MVVIREDTRACGDITDRTLSAWNKDEDPDQYELNVVFLTSNDPYSFQNRINRI